MEVSYYQIFPPPGGSTKRWVIIFLVTFFATILWFYV